MVKRAALAALVFMAAPTSFSPSASAQAHSPEYEANWRLAIALVDLGKQIPDSGKSSERDSIYTLAERHAGRAVAANPAGADGHFALALAIGHGALSKSTEERIRRATEIRTEALAAIELDPRHDGAYHVLGRWNAEIMRLSGISRFFARSFLGGGVFRYASWQAAIENLERAVDLDPTRIYHHLDLAEVYIDRKRFAEARTELEAVATLPQRDALDRAHQERAAELLERIARRDRNRSGDLLSSAPPGDRPAARPARRAPGSPLP